MDVRRMTIAGMLTVLMAACVDVPASTDPPPPADAGSTPRDGGGGDVDAGPLPTDQAAPTVAITSPSNGQAFPNGTGTVVIEGTASDDLGLAAVDVTLGFNAPVAAASQDFFRTWRVTLPLPVGTFTVKARATDVSGKQSEASISLSRAPAAADVSLPTLTISMPADQSSTTRQDVIVVGTASDDTGIAKVESRIDNLTGYTVVETDDNFATWRARVGIAPGVENLIRVRATDLQGKTAERTVRVTSLVAADQEAPTLIVTEPADGAQVAAESVLVKGTASDNLGVAKVEVRSGNGAYALANTSNAFAAWELSVPLVMGSNPVRVRATDVSGIETVVSLNVTGTFNPTWSDAKTIELRLAEPRDRSVSLVLDRQGLGEVIPESVRRSIVLLNLDPTALITSTLEAIKGACGSGWQSVSFTPSCPAAWGLQEFLMWKLLTMTPDNVNVSCTSIAGMREIADFLSDLGLIDSFSDILAATLGINRLSEIVDTTNAVAALKDGLIKTHPNTNADGTLPVTIQDGFTDMSELATTFGPSGNHPGFLDPSRPTFSKVLLDTFQMSVQGTSNLTWYDGVDLSMGKEYIALLPTPTTDVISFDFAGTMSVTGLAANPTVDLTLIMREDPAFHGAATRSNDQTAPAHPGLSSAWALDPWLIERILVDAGFRKYNARSAYLLYEDPIFGADESAIAIGTNDNDHFPVITTRPGWARFWTLFGLGDPPQGQYLWEMIGEISQVRLRDPNPDDCNQVAVPEGQGNVRFSMTGLPVGLTSQQIIDQMRPSMEAQKSVLAQRLLGDYRLNNGAVDLYLFGTTGNLFLFFVHGTDPLPATVTYAKPGFYSDPELTQKVSSTAAQGSGDAVHEKIPLTGAARTVYAQDDAGAVYRIEIEPAQLERVTVRVSRKLQ